MPAPSRFDRDGRCIHRCARGAKKDDRIVGWEKVAGKEGRVVNVPFHDCKNPTGLGPQYEYPPEPSFRRADSLPIAAAAVSGPGTIGGSTPEKASPSVPSRKKYVQIAAWVPANEAPNLLQRIAEIHDREDE